jgi:hypothetical protein
MDSAIAHRAGGYLATINIQSESLGRGIKNGGQVIPPIRVQVGTWGDQLMLGGEIGAIGGDDEG